MKETIAIIDCFIERPELDCYNHLVNLIDYPLSYHAPSKIGFSTLKNYGPFKSIIVLGSFSHIGEKLEWHIELAKYLDGELQKNIPVLGICFGHQLLADFYGGEVEFFHHNEEKITGKRKVKFDCDFGKINSGDFKTYSVSHSQYVSKISDNLEVLGGTKSHPFDIIKHRNLPFVGIQAHPEVALDFGKNNANLSDEEIQLCQDNGSEFILNFLSMFE